MKTFVGAVWLSAATVIAAAELPATGPVVPGFESYDREIPALMERWQIPGAAVAMAIDGRMVYARGFGLADGESGRTVQPDTRFRLCSVSKIITATAVLRLVDEGRLSLSDRVFPLLGYPTPTYAGAARDPRLDSITVHHVLSHTAGWLPRQAEIPFSGGVRGFDPAYAQRETAELLGLPSPASAETIVRAMVGQPLQAAPGTAYGYSNFGYLTLARLVELKTGENYEAAVRRILGASGIDGLRIGGSRRSELAADEAVYYDYPGAALMPSHLDVELVPQPYQYSLRTWDGSGGWVMSAIEGVRFLLALDGLNETPRLLRPETIARMRTEQFANTRYGYGWALYDKPGGLADGHAGGWHGSATWLLRSADGRVHWAAFFNNRPANDAVFFDDAYQVLLSGRPTLAPPEHDLTWSTLGWDAWVLRHQLTATVETDDPDHDGWSNLVEYAAGLDPTRAESEPPASLVVRSDGVPEFTYRRLLLEHPLTWADERSADGATWQTADAAGAQTELNADGTLSVSVPVVGACRARLRVHRASTGSEQVIEPIASPQQIVTPIGGSATLSTVPAPVGVNYRWRRNGVTLPAVTGESLALTNIQAADAGFYTVEHDSLAGSVRVVAVVAVRSTQKVSGAAEVVGADIRHPNGNVYDQVLLTGTAATITADVGQVTRISFVDLTDDIVQVELSGTGSLTVVLANGGGPELPANYRQQVRYMKGHATLVIADADATTNVSAFSVGRANATNQSLFRDEVRYDGIADLGALGIVGDRASFAGIYFGNAHLFAAAGVTGIHGGGVIVAGPVRLGDVEAFDGAVPMLLFGSVAEVLITGGELRQGNSRDLRVEGVGRLRMSAGAKSNGENLPAQPNQARIMCHGVDVTTWIVQP